jgi:hypothetical protein
MLTITQGDVVTLNLTAINNGVTFDLTGAIFTTTVRGPGGVIRVFPNSQHTANPNQTTHKGEFQLALSSADTASLVVWEGLEILTKVVIGSAILYFHGRHLLNVLSNQPQL